MYENIFVIYILVVLDSHSSMYNKHLIFSVETKF